MKEFIWRAVCGGAGTMAGTLLYQFFWQANHELDWRRACFIGAFAGVISALIVRKRKSVQNR